MRLPVTKMNSVCKFAMKLPAHTKIPGCSPSVLLHNVCITEPLILPVVNMYTTKLKVINYPDNAMLRKVVRLLMLLLFFLKQIITNYILVN